MKKLQRGLVLLLMVTILTSCAAKTSKKEGVLVPDWSVNATMYEVNIRQYTAEGTFEAFEEHLPRLKEMGIKVLWFMPVYPISQEKRISTLGSYYAVSDYKGINPEFGDKEDFKHLVDKCHEMGFKVVLDWVANHTGWDHPWVKNHPDWYTQDSEGNIIYPETWQDVADLNYDSKAMRKEMLDAMVYWVKEFDIDGYRCDYAGGVPIDFWENARTKLNKIKDVYMLAENDTSMAMMNYAFNSNYGWSFYRDLNDIAAEKKQASSLTKYMTNLATSYPAGAYPLHFIDNHDENSWTGTVEERMGDAQQAMLALIFTSPGMPLVYSGQEVNLDHRLEFFVKDEIVWDDFVNEEVLTKLIHLKLDHPAIWNGAQGGDLQFMKASSERVLAFTRQKDEDKVVVILNLSSKEKEVKVKFTGAYEGTDLMSGETYNFADGYNTLTMGAWEFLVLTQP